jgi:PAS domain S-box-containing protein
VETLKILQVEDDPSQAALLQAVLKSSMRDPYELVCVDRLSSALAQLAGDRIDVVLLDLGLPDSRGMETFTSVKDHAPHSAIIVFTGTNDEQMAVNTLQHGAQDYLVKTEVDRRVLVRAIRYAVERKRVADQLWEYEERTHLIIETARDAFVETDAHGLITDWNPRAEALFGWSRVEARGRPFADTIIAADHRQADRTLFTSAKDTVHGTRNNAVESLAMHRDGRLFPIELMVWQVRTRRDYRFNAFIRDITERKRAEKALAEEHDLLDSLIESLPDQIYVKDSAGRFLRANSAVARFFGMSSPDLLKGKSDFDLFPHGLAQQFFDEEQRVIQSGQSLVNRETFVTDQRNTARWELTTKAPFRDHSGNIVGTVGINRDVTMIKKAEDDLRQANTELEKNQKELERIISELQKAHTELRSAHLELIEIEKFRTIGRLAAGVAHEVKNPLAIMLRGISYLSKTPAADDATIRSVLDDMRNAIGRADAVIRGLLDFAAPSEIVAEPEDVNKLIDDSLMFVKHLADEGGIKVIKQLDPELPRCRVDRRKIEEVLINVFENAIHAMPQGGALSVRTFPKVLTGFGSNVGGTAIDRFKMGDMLVVIEVDDSGTGVASDNIAKVFDPFFTTKPTGQGTGLGLSVSKTIMDLHGGSIEIRNREEGGARVTLVMKAG